MHVCYVPETSSIDLGRQLYNDPAMGRLAKSLVFASPKHMTWSIDPGLVMLPLESSSRYIFHGETPRPQEVLKRNGYAVEWEAWGPGTSSLPPSNRSPLMTHIWVRIDGNTPVLASDYDFRERDLNITHGCHVDFDTKTARCHNRQLLIQPWAAYSTPEEIQANKQKVRDRTIKAPQTEMHFQGTIWSCNAENLLSFVSGCYKQGITVTQYSKHQRGDLPYPFDVTENLVQLPNFLMKESKQSLEELFEEKGSQYGPAFQGKCHFEQHDESLSYVADRILNLVAIGVHPMTNNLAAFELLVRSPAIVYDKAAYGLCKKSLDHTASKQSLLELMDVVARGHTYVSRLSTMLHFVEELAIDSHHPLRRRRLTQTDGFLPIEPDSAFRSNALTDQKRRMIGSLEEMGESQHFDELDTRYFPLALQKCNNDLDCVLTRVRVHASGHCKGAMFARHKTIGQGLSYDISTALPCPGYSMIDQMTAEDYVKGKPVVHFIDDPLEVVVEGYQRNIKSNEPWLVDSGLQKRLLAKTLDKALTMEFRALDEWNIQHSQAVYAMQRNDHSISRDFFTVRVSQLRDEKICTLTVRALRIWLGIRDELSAEVVEKCCFQSTKQLSEEEETEKALLRDAVMDVLSGEIYAYRKEMDFPLRGRENWKRPKKNFAIPILLFFVAVFLGVCSQAIPFFGAKVGTTLASSYLKRQAPTDTERYYVPQTQTLVKRFCVEWSRETPFLGLRDSLLGGELDVQQTFAPRPILWTRVRRLVLFCWSLRILWVDLHLFRYPFFYFAFFSQVTFGCTILFFFSSMLVAFSPSLKQSDFGKLSLPGILVPFYWVRSIILDCFCFTYCSLLSLILTGFFATISTCQFIVTSVYWATHVHFFLYILPAAQRYSSVMKHGGFFVLTLLDGMVYSRIPLRAKHLVFPLGLIALYGSWTIFQSFFGPTNPFFYGQEHGCHPDDDDAVYSQLNWSKHPTRSSRNWILGTIFVPAHFYVLWVLSLWSGGSRFDGTNQRFVQTTEQEGGQNNLEQEILTKLIE